MVTSSDYLVVMDKLSALGCKIATEYRKQVPAHHKIYPSALSVLRNFRTSDWAWTHPPLWRHRFYRPQHRP